MSPSPIPTSLVEFPRFNDLPTELRFIIWRLISLPEPVNKDDNTYKAVNIFPQCDGRYSHSRHRHSKVSTRQGQFRVLSWVLRRERKITQTPLPITTKINRESRAETFKYWVIELYPKRGWGPLCFLPTHHKIEVNRCCLIEPHRKKFRKRGEKAWNSMDFDQQLAATKFGTWEFRRWIQYLRKEHPGQIEKIREVFCVVEAVGAAPRTMELLDIIEKYRVRARQLGDGASSEVGAEKSDWTKWSLFDNILEFPGMRKIEFRWVPPGWITVF